MTEPTPTTDATAAKPSRRQARDNRYSQDLHASLALRRLQWRICRHITTGDADRALRLLYRAEALHLQHQPKIPYSASRILADGLYTMRCLVAAMTSREADVRGQLAVLAEVKREFAAAVGVLR